MLKYRLVKHAYRVYVVCDMCDVTMIMHEVDNPTNPLNYTYKCRHCGRTETHPVISGEYITETFPFDPLEEQNGN